MEVEDAATPRRSSTRIRKLGARLEEALLDPNARQQAIQARLDALENDNVAMDAVAAAASEAQHDDDFMGDDDAVFVHKRPPKGSKRKTRQSLALERSASKGPKSFLDLLEEANLGESLPPHVPSYVRAGVGPPSRASRRHFCAVCGYSANYTCPRCAARFCSCHCQTVHNDTRCQKFVT
ncbi:hypothetical protein SELMODRAFT_97641 [Selaginella moellendorffii]|uniref:HIT-type domain-containing protein n=1 Tax=Selaginella moellendorffii TaxID=88036 RepID=D8RM93_SELML|nr:SWR1 complex subunit 6 [Selaginella moellendorffii]EFJ26497.1 hypothetical protein SELMODRAFT_97641 [Selaginella moellendorffii]|eukprot:XP_002972411.1 SWR1 complex subunit 6 [Selaginella moellendorffii]